MYLLLVLCFSDFKFAFKTVFHFTANDRQSLAHSFCSSLFIWFPEISLIISHIIIIISS